MAITSLPKFFVLSFPIINRPFLCLEEASHRLKFNGEELKSHSAKFATVQSKTGDETLVHIRSCYNNKYWVAGPDNKEILASADKPEEDTANPGCTLFRVSPSTGPPKPPTQCFRFFSISTRLYVTVQYPFHGEGLPLLLSPFQDDEHFLGFQGFHPIDWEELIILPSLVTFSSDHNGGNNFLCTRVVDGECKFESGLDFHDERVIYELIPWENTSADYVIMSPKFRRYWKKASGDDNRILADGLGNNSFNCIKISDNVIALRSKANGNFCGPDKNNCLSAEYPTKTKETWLTIQEPIIKRDITILEYHLPASRIHKEEVVALAEQTIENGSTKRDLEQVVSFSESIETVTSWNNNISVKAAASVNFEVGWIPLIAKGEVHLSAEAGYERQWGGSKTTQGKIETTTKVLVPPSTNMKVSLLCTKAYCDVPFSYSQTDYFPNNRMVSVVMHDGNYRGVNAYEFKIRSVEVDEHGQELKPPKIALV